MDTLISTLTFSLVLGIGVIVCADARGPSALGRIGRVFLRLLARLWRDMLALHTAWLSAVDRPRTEFGQALVLLAGLLLPCGLLVLVLHAMLRAIGWV
jgi:hypothetical protein